MWIDNILNYFQNFRLFSHPPISHVVVINSKLYHHHRNILIRPLVRHGAELNVKIKEAAWLSHNFALLGNSILLDSLSGFPFWILG